jgi:hypothetical protein
MVGLDDHLSHPAPAHPAPAGFAETVRNLFRRLFATPAPTAPSGPVPVNVARIPVVPRSAAPVRGPRPVPKIVVPQAAGAAHLAQGAFQPSEADPQADHLPPLFRPKLAPTTHTYEMSQLSVLDERLRRPEATPLTAADLGLAHKVPAHAVLISLRWEGPPECPYVHGGFSGGEVGEPVVVDLGAVALREISQRLGLRQVWNE